MLSLPSRAEYLHCTATGELTLLPQSADGWEITLDGSVPYLCSEDHESIWIYDHAEFVPFVRHGTAELCGIRCRSNDVMLSVAGFKASIQQGMLGVPMLAGCTYSTRFWLSAQTVGGMRLSFSLARLASATLKPHRGGKSRNKRASKCVDSRWDAWVNFCRHANLPEPVQSQPYQLRSDDLASYSTAAVASGRTVSVPRALTSSFLAIVLRLAYANAQNGGCISAEAAQANKLLADALIRRARITALHVSARGRPGPSALWSGNGMCVLHVQAIRLVLFVG